MIIAIYGNRHQDDFIDGIISFVRFIIGRGDSIVFHHKIDRYLRDNVGEAYSRLVEDQCVVENDDFHADIAVSIGGDGTFLRTAHWIGRKEIPVIGINTGHLGFLAPFSLADARVAVEAFAAGRCRIEDRSLLCVDLPTGRFETWPYALNEVAVLKKDTASMITAVATIDRAPLADYLCDGLIVSTPTGSTGYNLSVGGPIVEPSSPSIVISPIAAHTLTMRPLVVPDSSLLQVRVGTRANTFRISLDGRSVSLPAGSDFYITRADFVVKVVQKPDFNFFATLREKLLWGTTNRPSGC